MTRSVENYDEHEEGLCRMFKQITRSIVIVVETLSADTLAKLLDTSKEGVDQTLLIFIPFWRF
jgi:hypothetical protein